ncbi:MAG: hypothetical protein JSV77_08015 [Dehalococcoidales bacterium]|nr:MAG: hypothetical protein JSV77_08015 [Dehalococcoidales bacterium]
MKVKGLLLTALAAMIALSIPIVALAGSDATITITMSGPSVAIDIEVTPAEWQIEAVELNSSYLKDFTLVNRGSVRVDTTIMGTNAEGNGYRWWLSTFPGNNMYEIEYDIEGFGGMGNVTTIPTEFVQDLYKNQSQHFSLTVKTPTSGGSPGAGESIQATVTIHAVQGR